MSLRASGAIVRHELRVIRQDPSTVIFVLIMPLLLVALMQGLFKGALANEGLAGTSGAEFAVPGMAVSFAAFGAGFAGFAFFRDHGWGTWDRLRASPASSADIIVGKVVPPVAVTTLQMLGLFLLAVPLFGFHVSGSWAAVVVLIVMLALCLNAFGVAATAISKTSQQLNAIGSAGGLVLATLGGAFVPISAMPGWARSVAPAFPTYWAMRGLRAVVLGPGGLPDILLPVVVLLAFTTLFGGLAAARFRFEESKVYWG